MIELERQLKKLITDHRFSEVLHLSQTILEASPNNISALQAQIEYYFRHKNFANCLKQCNWLLDISPKNKLAALQSIMCLIELKQYLTAKDKISTYIATIGCDSEVLLLKAEVGVCVQDFDSALAAYQELHAFSPRFFSQETLKQRPNDKQHFSNVSNLLKRNAYLKVQRCLGISPRLDRAVKCFFGLEKQAQNHQLQLGSFFNMPGLTTKPYYQVDEISGLKSFVDEVETYTPLLKFIIDNADKENYMDAIAAKNSKEQWQVLSKQWQSIHILKAAQECKVTPEIEKIQQVFSNSLIADCPPHAPEVFISILPPGAVIPPHYGLSNIKLTVHVPIDVDENSNITVAGESKAWHDEGVIIFDDSFLHSANNHSTKARSVLIFDIWHPDLNSQEREAIKIFMQTYDTWSAQYGGLSKAANMALINN